jgi:hypothetical protein
MKDALGVLQSATTQTASANSTGINIKGGTPKRGLVANFRVTSISGTSPTAQFQIEHSDDNTTYTDVAISETLTAAGQTSVTFESPKAYVRAVSVIGGTAPSVVWDCYIGSGKATVN